MMGATLPGALGDSRADDDHVLPIVLDDDALAGTGHALDNRGEVRGELAERYSVSTP